MTTKTATQSAVSALQSRIAKRQNDLRHLYAHRDRLKTRLATDDTLIAWSLDVVRNEYKWTKEDIARLAADQVLDKTLQRGMTALARAYAPRRPYALVSTHSITIDHDGRLSYAVSDQPVLLGVI